MNLNAHSIWYTLLVTKTLREWLFFISLNEE